MSKSRTNATREGRWLLGFLLLAASVLRAEITTVVEHIDNEHALPTLAFTNVSRPTPAVAAAGPKFVIVEGQQDPNSAGVSALTDGLFPEEEDDPAANFFFKAGTDGGRLLLDLGTGTALREINSFSWHPASRGPQVYTLYGSDGAAPGFDAQPKRPVNPSSVGWELLARVDTRSGAKDTGGQYAVHITAANGAGTFRYLLFDILPTETDDAFGNTFYSEISVVPASQVLSGKPSEADCIESLETADGVYQIAIDTCDTPDLHDWTRTALAPALREWYPKIVALLPSEGFVAPRQVTVRFSERMRGVAATGGTHVSCAAKWFRANLKGEARGSVVHELVHVVQQYVLAQRAAADAPRAPGWLVEGIADYIRWFLYEPQSHGADLVWLRQRRNPQLQYDAGYRITANFLNWVTERYDKQIVPQLNAALRGATYREELWQQLTGHSLQDLAGRWKRDLASELGDPAPSTGN